MIDCSGPVKYIYFFKCCTFLSWVGLVMTEATVSFFFSWLLFFFKWVIVKDDQWMTEGVLELLKVLMCGSSRESIKI